MNTVRICDNNIFDLCQFPEYSNTTYLDSTYKQYEIYQLWYETAHYSAIKAQDPLRGSILSTKISTSYNLKAITSGTQNINYIALNRVNIPATAKLTLYMWNESDWSASTQDYVSNDYTAKFSAENIGQATGWGSFDWGSPWAGTKPLTATNPMSNTIILWFDEGKYGYSLTTPSDTVITNKTVSDVIRWRLEIDFENGVPSRTGTFSTDRIFIGEYLDLQYNMSHGHSLTFEDTSKQYRSTGGSLISNFAPRFKRLKVSFPVVSATDRTKLSSLFARVGVNRDIIFSLYPKNSEQQLEVDYTVTGKFRKVPSLVERIGGYYKTTMEIGET